MDEQAQVAAFLATRGATRLAPGVSSGFTNRDWRAKVRGEMTDNELIEQRRVTIDSAGREHVTNGLGERIA